MIFINLTPKGNLLTPNAVVLREETAASRREGNEEPNLWVYPTVGTHFFLSREAMHQLVVLKIYNIAGTLVGIWNPQNQASWKADHLPEGIYILRAETGKRRTTSQRIIIQK